MLHVQQFLSTYSIAELESRYHIKATRHGKYSNLVLLKYHQFESPFHEPLVQECRGLILDQDDSYRVVAAPYWKFFNYGEPIAHSIDWSTAKVWDKVDGSLMTLYHYRDEWHVSTSGVPDAETNVQDFGFNFRYLFWKTFDQQNLDLDNLDPGYCYMLELCAPENRVVVRHTTPRLYLHGMRNISTLQEEDPTFWAKAIGAELPSSYSLSSIDACIAAAEQLDPIKNEGYVVCDGLFNRVKVKSPRYLLLHHAKVGLLSRRRLADLVRKGEGDEVLAYFPELRPNYEELENRYNNLVIEAEVVYNTIRGIESQKDFALAAKQYPSVQHFMYAMRKLKCTPQEYIDALQERAYLRLMEIKE